MRIKVGEKVEVRVPYDIREAIELYAREVGRSATIHFIPEVGWMVRFGLRSNDPRGSLLQSQRVGSLGEDVYFHVRRRDYDPKQHPAILPPRPGSKQTWVPLDIIQMGASGVREFLEAGNTWSGRGVFASQQDALRRNEELNAREAAAIKERARESTRERVRERWRKLKGLPFLGWTRSIEK